MWVSGEIKYTPQSLYMKSNRHTFITTDTYSIVGRHSAPSQSNEHALSNYVTIGSLGVPLTASRMLSIMSSNSAIPISRCRSIKLPSPGDR